MNEIFQFIDEYQNRYKLGSSIGAELQLIAEEMFTNMVKYNLHSKKAISLELSKKGNDLLITFTDKNGLPFRLESTVPYDTTLPLEERPIGRGLVGSLNKDKPLRKGYVHKGYVQGLVGVVDGEVELNIRVACLYRGVG